MSVVTGCDYESPSRLDIIQFTVNEGEDDDGRADKRQHNHRNQRQAAEQSICKRCECSRPVGLGCEPVAVPSLSARNRHQAKARDPASEHEYQDVFVDDGHVMNLRTARLSWTS